MARREDFDVCVIGTGAGGGVLIDQLTAAGFRVVALQRGPHLRTKDLVDHDELKIAWRNELFSPDQLERWRLDENSPTESGRFNSVAHCVGGTMVHWSAWSWRFRPDEFRVLSTEGPVEGASLDWNYPGFVDSGAGSLVRLRRMVRTVRPARHGTAVRGRHDRRVGTGCLVAPPPGRLHAQHLVFRHQLRRSGAGARCFR